MHIPNINDSEQVRFPIREALTNKGERIVGVHMLSVLCKTNLDHCALFFVDNFGVLGKTVHAPKCEYPNHYGEHALESKYPPVKGGYCIIMVRNRPDPHLQPARWPTPFILRIHQLRMPPNAPEEVVDA
jgi:hypothetical protein